MKRVPAFGRDPFDLVRGLNDAALQALDECSRRRITRRNQAGVAGLRVRKKFRPALFRHAHQFGERSQVLTATLRPVCG